MRSPINVRVSLLRPLLGVGLALAAASAMSAPTGIVYTANERDGSITQSKAIVQGRMTSSMVSGAVKG